VEGYGSTPGLRRCLIGQVESEDPSRQRTLEPFHATELKRACRAINLPIVATRINR
jgi:hypothetical protein